MRAQGYYKARKVIINSLIHLFLIAVAVSCLVPMLWMVSSSLKTQETVFADNSFVPGELHFENYLLAWREGGFGRYFFNSILYTVSAVTGIVLIASLAAYAFSRLRFPGRNILFVMFVAAMMIPLPGSFVALYVLLNKLHLRNTAAGYVLCMISVGLSMSIFLLKTFFDRLPRELEDAARMDGATKLGIWWHVAMPLARPVLAVVVIFNALNVWNEYVLAMLIFDDKALMPLQRALMVFRGEYLTNYPLLMAGLTITALPIILVYLFMQKYIVRGVTAQATFG
jgi:multiple sugar transport system permease protein/raffinose/stachyose/melibiose transport system permease protein